MRQVTLNIYDYYELSIEARENADIEIEEYDLCIDIAGFDIDGFYTGYSK